jgi:hypothetical protein
VNRRSWIVHRPLPAAPAPGLHGGVLPAAAAAGPPARRRRRRSWPATRWARSRWATARSASCAARAGMGLRGEPGLPAALGGRRTWTASSTARFRSRRRSSRRSSPAGWTWRSIRPPQVQRLEAAGDVRVITFPVPNWVFLAHEHAAGSLFADRDVRRAIAMAIDRQALVDGIMGGHNERGRASVTPVHWAYDAGARRSATTPTPRGLLLERAGWVDRDGDGIREDGAGPALPLPPQGLAAAPARTASWPKRVQAQLGAGRHRGAARGRRVQHVRGADVASAAAAATSRRPSATGRTTCCARTTRSCCITQRGQPAPVDGLQQPAAGLRCSTPWPSP